jgi:nitroreductase
MQALQALRKRRSVRVFNTKPVPRNLVEELIDCARLAGLLGDFTDSSSLFGAVFALNQELRDTKELLAMAQGVTEGTGDVTIQLTIPERHVASIKDVAEANEMDIGRYMNLRVTEGLDAMWFV